MDKCGNKWTMNLSMNKLCTILYICVKHVFNTWYLCMKCMDLWMNEFCTISLLNHCMPNLWYTFHNHCFLFSSNYVLIMVFLVMSFHLFSSFSTTFASKPPCSIGCFAIDVLPYLSTCYNIGHYYKMWVQFANPHSLN